MCQLVPLGTVKNIKMKHEIQYCPCGQDIEKCPYYGLAVGDNKIPNAFHVFIVDNMVVLSSFILFIFIKKAFVILCFMS